MTQECGEHKGGRANCPKRRRNAHRNKALRTDRSVMNNAPLPSAAEQPIFVANDYHSRRTKMKRIALKSVTYCLMHLTVAIGVAYALTGSWKVALAVGIIEPIVQTAFFTIHDRAWARADRRHAERRAGPPGESDDAGQLAAA